MNFMAVLLFSGLMIKHKLFRKYIVTGYRHGHIDPNNLIIPDGINIIEKGAFKNAPIKKVTLPESLVEMGEEAFKYCKDLHEITIPPKLKVIPSSAFSYCTLLVYVHFSVGVTTISSNAFYRCDSLSEIKLPKSVREIHNGAFRQCKNVTVLKLNDGLESIDDYAFEYCECLEDVEISDSVKKIGVGVFSSCHYLKSVSLSENITSIPKDMFCRCFELQNVVIPYGITQIGHRAFESCYRLKEIVIPDSVTTISSEAFGFCSNLEKVIMSKNVKHIGESVFYSCTSLKELRISGTNLNMIDPVDSYYRASAMETLCDFIKSDDKEPIFREMPETHHKIPCAIYLFLKNDSETAKEYICKNSIKTALYLIRNKDMENLMNILPIEPFSIESIDFLIKYTIDNKLIELQVIFSNYKNDHFDFTDNFDKYLLD